MVYNSQHKRQRHAEFHSMEAGEPLFWGESLVTKEGNLLIPNPSANSASDTRGPAKILSFMELWLTSVVLFSMPFLGGDYH
jgi:hypothetical protein